MWGRPKKSFDEVQGGGIYLNPASVEFYLTHPVFSGGGSPSPEDGPGQDLDGHEETQGKQN